jgi:DNA topoisomerase I
VGAGESPGAADSRAIALAFAPEAGPSRRAGRLRRVDWTGPGITRRRCGRGFRYLDAEGRPLEDPSLVERIQKLAIPPAWRDVWICSHPMGHLQAVGIDAAGRRQYLYHELWRARRNQTKFEHMVAFGRALPHLRRAVARDLARDDLSRERVLAAAVRLLDRGFFRMGTESYKRANGTFGLATLHKEHVRMRDGRVLAFDYLAKGGKRRVETVLDPDVAAVVRRLKRRRGGGEELLAWRDGDRWVDVRSADINTYIRENSGRSGEAPGGDFSAKDFRTWSATVLAFVYLAETGPPPPSPTARKRVISQVVGRVAHYLGNTPAVARSSYIDPRILDHYASGEAAGILASVDPPSGGELAQDLLTASVERTVLGLLEDDRSEEAVA